MTALQSGGAAANAQLSDAVLRLGAVTEAKRVLDTHTNCSWAIAQQLTQRGFVHYWQLERDWMKGGQFGGSAPADWVARLTDDANIAKGTAEDRLRLALIGLLARPVTRDTCDQVGSLPSPSSTG